MEKNEKLAISLGNEFNMRIEGMEEEFKSILTGIETPNYLIVRMLIPTGFRRQIDTGTTFIVRYVYLGNVYGFRTKSLGSVDKPYRVTFLSYPEKVESLNIRKSKRVSCFIPATLDLNKIQLKGLIMEISKSGARFSINTDTDLIKNVKINEPLKVSFPLLGFEGTHMLKGNIKSFASDSAGISFGIQFRDVNASLENIIDSYVKDVLELI